MRSELTASQSKVAAKIRWQSECVDQNNIRPVSVKDDGTMKTTRAIGLALWQSRESFVEFFSSEDPEFNADLFRKTCYPEDTVFGT